MPPQPWYHEGLAFTCTACGNCCRDHGEYSYVYLAEADVERIAAHVGQDPEVWRAAWTDEEDGWTFLKRDGKDCPLLAPTGLCSVYEARPMQCRTWPFWEDTVRSREAWETEVRPTCPGAGQGTSVPHEEVTRIARETEAWYDADE